jgi:hypothetical protein
VLRLDDKTGLVFGAVDAGGVLKSLLEVSSTGNLKVSGTIADAPRRGDVFVLSGVVANAVKLPLPPGVDEQQLAAGNFDLHVWLRPHPSETPRPAGETWFDTTVECRLDEDRFVHCRVRSIQLKATGFETEEGPVPADFLLFAVASAGTGG